MNGGKQAAFAALLLAACRPSADEARPGPPAIASAAELAGSYRVTAMDGTAVARPITATIDAQRIELASDCVKMAWTYRFEQQHLVTAQAPAEGCARAFDPTEQDLLAAFGVADAAQRTGDKAIAVSGGGHSVTLSRQ